jgi:hypothetical protein
MNEISEAMRTRLIETLALIASETAQRAYQNEVPDVDVPAELFNQWEDCFFPDDAMFRDGFSFSELDQVLNEVCEETPTNLPVLDEFVKTPSWQKLSHAADAALSAMKKTGTPS